MMDIDKKPDEKVNKKIKKETVVEILEPDNFHVEVIFKPR
jgi:hypothetical protein